MVFRELEEGKEYKIYGTGFSLHSFKEYTLKVLDKSEKYMTIQINADDSTLRSQYTIDSYDMEQNRFITYYLNKKDIVDILINNIKRYKRDLDEKLLTLQKSLVE